MGISNAQLSRRAAFVGLAAVVGGTGLIRWRALADPPIAGAASAVAVSGEAMPTGDIPGWRQIFSDDFTGDTLSDSWGVYNGTPSGDPASLWAPNHVQVRDSKLILQGYRENGRWITGGVSNHPVARTYGKWEMRFRMDASDEIPVAFLLWPQGGDWPPEIDFLEDAGGDRSQASGFVHYRTSDGRSKVQRSVTADFTMWQTVGVEWMPGVIRYTLNGQVWGTVTGDTVPAQPMWLALQAQSGGCQRRVDAGAARCPVAGTPDQADVQVDWVAVYAPL